MKHRDRDYIAYSSALLLALTAFYFTYQIHLIFAAIATATTYLIIYQIIYSLLPTKKKKTTTKVNLSNTKKTVNTTSPILRSDEEILLLPIEQLGWKEFERLIFLYYQSKGYHPVATKDGADGGVDVLYNHPYHKNKVAVQIKHWNNTVGVKHIRELDSAKKNYGCILTEFITSSYFTQPAKNEADKLRMERHDRTWVDLELNKWRKKEATKRKLIS